MSQAVSREERLRGARFGAHAVVRLLGQGATAAVFEGVHVTLGKRVAIKVLHEHLAASKDVGARFLREGRVVAQLQHPNIVDVSDVGIERGVPYLVMELLEGRDLRAELDERVRLPCADAIALILPLASALAHAHDRGAIHRDLKPANVFIALDHRGEVVPKIVDFGLSKIACDEDDKNPLTSTDAVVGTVLYMAPEQTMASKLTTAKSDQYAMAGILYEVLTGTPAFHAQGFYALIEAIRTAPVRPPSSIDPRIPEGLDDVILRALHRNPDKRWPNTRMFGEALLPFADDATSGAWARDFSPSRSSNTRAAAPVSAAAIASAAATTAADVSGVRTISPLPCAPGKSPFHIKGIAYRGVVQSVTKAMANGLDTVCDAIDDARVRDFLRQPFLAGGWYDILPVLPIAAAIARVTNRSLAEVARAGAIAQCRYDAQTVFKRMFESTSLEDLVERFPRFGARYYDFGAFDGWAEEPGHHAVRQTNVPAYLEAWFAPMHAAYGEETTRLLGAAHAVATERSVQSAGAQLGFPVITVVSDVRWRR